MQTQFIIILMRKLIVSVNITLDGFVADADGGLDWHLQSWSSELADAVAGILSRADTLLLGRKTYQAMAAYWPWQAKNMNFPREDIAYAEMMNSCQKVVFSSTMQSAGWNNSVLLKGDLKKEVIKLKKQSGNDILTYGSISTVKKLIAFNLVDEYQLWVHPINLGRGLPFLKVPKGQPNADAVSRTVFGSGVVLAVYRNIL